MKDRYLNTDETFRRLLRDFIRHNNLIIAFDYDNTVYDYHGEGDSYPKLEELLRKLASYKEITLILFTSSSPERIADIRSRCISRGYEPDYINESPVGNGEKPYYNLLLDDRAGLKEAYETIQLVLKILTDFHELTLKN